MQQQFLTSDPIGSQLQSQYRLKVLTLCLDRGSGEPQVVLELTAPDDDAPASQTALLTCPSADVGLPSHLQEQNLPDSMFRLPDDMRVALTSALAQAQPHDGPVWLKFATPVGLLPVVPWERLLQPLAHAPVLRLPYHRLSPVARSRNLDCAVCFSSPSTAVRGSTDAVIATFLHQIPLDLVEHMRLHLFGDLNVQPQLHDLKTRFGSRYDIRVYDPPETTRRSRETRTVPGATRLENPWLIWMRDALGRRKLDVVHFLGHSYVSGEEGALALARSPATSDDRWQEGYIGAAELVEFLNQTGAWSVAFTSPPDNISLIGLRLLQDQIARLRPGPCFLHDMADSGGGDALGQTYRFLFNPNWHAAAVSPAVSLYCHPWRALEGGAVDETSERVMERVTLVSRIGEAQFADEDQGWLTSAQRVLEQSATTLDSDPAPEQEASVEGRRNALEFVADSLAKYANESASTQDTSTDASETPAGSSGHRES